MRSDEETPDGGTPPSLIREMLEERERATLSPFASLCAATKGRACPERECDLRTAFQRDRDRIIHAKAFRRLKHKTQVFIAPEGDHYRTRLTHTLEVSQVARTIARALRLNEDLAEAIALGHDLGHTPFGHAGEGALDRLATGGFRHNEQSLRVVEFLERRSPAYPGLNLTWEVRDGIARHTGDERAATLEGQVVHLADRIAYVNHDIDDAVRAGVLSPADLPCEVVRVLGETTSSRIDRLVRAVVRASWNQPDVAMATEEAQALAELREFMFARVYISSRAKGEEGKVAGVIEALFGHYRSEKDSEQDVVDFIAGMTDRFALSDYMRVFVPAGWREL